MIPKLIHFIWLGGQRLPRAYEVYIEGWRTRHRGWEVRLWCDADIPALQLKNQSQYESVQSAVMRSNILRYELVARFGGVYADIDYECLRCLDPLLEEVPAFVVSLEPAMGLRPFTNSCFGAEPHHPLFVELVERVPVQMQTYSTGPVTLRNGSAFFSQLAARQQGLIRFGPPLFQLSPTARTVQMEGGAEGALLRHTYAIHRSRHAPMTPLMPLLPQTPMPSALLPPVLRAMGVQTGTTEIRGTLTVPKGATRNGVSNLTPNKVALHLADQTVQPLPKKGRTKVGDN